MAQENQCSSTVGLTNAHGKDLDTDFLGNASQQFTDAQPETRAVMDVILEKGYTLSVALDGGSVLATYPYNKPVQPVENEDTLKYLASVYAKNHPTMHLGRPGCDSNQGMSHVGWQCQVGCLYLPWSIIGIAENRGEPRWLETGHFLPANSLLACR
uniref:Peptidase M14 domain-containing protein n=1 Tax=Lepisosteus oculatus TaxID=7918 RepID=W5MEF0_LEPOC